MTLGDVWDLQPNSTESTIRDVLAQAQGEMALEEFLKQVRETWQNYALDLVNYQNKCRLIRGWDDLFAKCSENLLLGFLPPRPRRDYSNRRGLA